LQAAIDSAKRRFDTNISESIRLIKEDMDVKNIGYPKFWQVIKRGFSSANINKDLICPMNYLVDLKTGSARSPKNSIKLADMIYTHEYRTDKKVCRRVEDAISKYSLHLYDYNRSRTLDDETYILLRSDFDDLIADLRKIRLSHKYRDLIIRLLDRAFLLKKGTKRNASSIHRKTAKNKSLLLKVLYDSNPEAFLSCFKKQQETYP